MSLLIVVIFAHDNAFGNHIYPNVSPSMFSVLKINPYFGFRFYH